MSSSAAARLAIVQVLCLILVAVCLIPAGAHLFEMAGKRALPGPDYMTVQRIYAGWALFGIPIIAAIAALVVHCVLVRKRGMSFWLSLLALAAILAAQLAFWIFVFPMNALTQNWTVSPPDIQAARAQWEYGHAASAVLSFVAFVAVCLAVVYGRPIETLPSHIRGPKPADGRENAPATRKRHWRGRRNPRSEP